MPNSLPVAVKQVMAASGGLSPVSLLEVLTLSGNTYFWSDAFISTPAVVATALQSGGAQNRSVSAVGARTSTSVQADIGGVHAPGVFSSGPVSFIPWILTPPSFHGYKSLQTTTAQLTIQNLSGNTVQRDAAQIFARTEMIGALCFYRLWKVEAECALYSFLGNIDGVDVDVDGSSISLSLRSWCNWSAIKAPYKQIGVSCPLTFGSVECGSAAAAPCNNDYGSCTSRNRIQAIVLEWTGAALNYSQYAQPEPLRLVNNRVAG